MTTYKTTHHDLITGEITVIDYTPEQIAEVEARLAIRQAEQEAEAQVAAKREAALEKLSALGLTADDLKALGL